jgi:cytochrome c-type biogenesis protein CcmH
LTRRLIALLLVLLAAAAAAAGASAAVPRTSVNDVEDEVMCVACGVPLAIAESPQADRERAFIRRLVLQGKTKSQVKDELVATYGSRVLATPQDHGFGLAAYLVPIALVLAALLAGAIAVPKWRRKRQDGDGDDPGGGTAAPALSADDARRLEDDLARYDV